MLPILINILLVIHVFVSLLIVLLVLMQRPKNEGLGAAFGGGMTENLFGAQTTNVLQTITRWLGGLFFALTLLLSWLYVKKGSWHSTPIQQQLSAPTVVPPAATPPPSDTPALETTPPATTPAATPSATSEPAKPGEPKSESPAAPASTDKPAAALTPAPSAPATPPATPEPKPAEPAK